MKSYNVDSKLKDRKIIKKALIKVCKSKKKKKKGKNKKYKQAQYILKHMDSFVETTLEIVIATEIIMEREEERLFIDDEYFFTCFKPVKCKSFYIKDGPSGKEREITSVPLFPDQIIHQLDIEAGAPAFMKGMYAHSCGSIPKRGAHKGHRYIKKVINHHNKYDKSAIKYGAQLDATKCYQSFSHTYLKNLFRKKFRGKLFLYITFLIIDSYTFIIIEDPATGKVEAYGLPIGYSTSQWFCNFGLTPLDHYIKEDLHIEYYVRYIDDMIMFERNKKELHKVVMAINEFMAKMGLKLKQTWQVFRYDYIDKNGKRKGRVFDTLGLRFFRDKTILRKRNSLTIKRQVQKINKKEEIKAHDAMSLMSRLGQLRHCNSYNFYQKYIKPYTNIKKLKEVIRIESRKQCKTCGTV